MADNDISLIMRIRSIFEGKGHADAVKNAETLAKTSTDAGRKGADAMNLMGTATQAMNGNFEGAISGVTQLIGKIKVLGMSMMQLSLVAAVLTSLVKLFQAIAERADAMAAGMRQIKSDNVTAAITRINKSYDEMTEAADRAAKARNANFDLNQKELDSLAALTLANQELSKQVELRNAKTPEERAAIEAKYKSSADATKDARDNSKSEAQRNLLLSQASEAETSAADAQAQIEALKAQAARVMAQTGYAQGQANQFAQHGTAANFFTGGSYLKQSESFASEASKGQATFDKLISAIESLQKTVADSEALAAAKRREAGIVNLDQTAAGLATEAGGIAAATAASDREAAAKAEATRQRLQAELDAAQERLEAFTASRNETKERLAFRATAAQRAADAATAAATRMGNRDYGISSDRAAKETAEALAAAKAVQDYAAQTTAMLRDLAAAMKTQRDALRNLPN